LLGECLLVIDCHNTLAQSLWASICIHLVILMFCLAVCAERLSLRDNTLTGPIPSEINRLVNLGEFVSCHVPLSFVLAQSALMNILLVCFFVSQYICVSMTICSWATTLVQTQSSLAKSPANLLWMTTATLLTIPTLVALFEWCFNKQHDVASNWNSHLGPGAWRRVSVVVIYVKLHTII
jgi:hypothetical protein